MSDERLRSLERRWRASGAVEDELALLRERLRAGLLDEQRVRLAAGLEHVAAAALAPHPRLFELFVERRTYSVEGEALTRWNARCGRVRDRWPFGEEALRRVCASATRCGLRTWEAFVAGWRGPPVEGLPDLARDLRVLVAMLTEARTADAEEASEISERLHELVSGDLLAGDDAMFDALNAVATLADFLAGEGSEPDPDEPWSVRGDDDPAAWCVALAMNATSAEAVAAALREDVAAWALGHGDPLRAWLTST